MKKSLKWIGIKCKLMEIFMTKLEIWLVWEYDKGLKEIHDLILTVNHSFSLMKSTDWLINQCHNKPTTMLNSNNNSNNKMKLTTNHNKKRHKKSKNKSLNNKMKRNNRNPCHNLIILKCLNNNLRGWLRQSKMFNRYFLNLDFWVWSQNQRLRFNSNLKKRWFLKKKIWKIKVQMSS